MPRRPSPGAGPADRGRRRPADRPPDTGPAGRRAAPADPAGRRTGPPFRGRPGPRRPTRPSRPSPTAWAHSAGRWGPRRAGSR
ncbi:hypothetical protein DDQ41_08425 [Streptomyces spongiicola]|uniref:Uncharacterized protein n=1 Tax=Streptomyces spongiicola TaxID=1690221 RepID=A0ABN5KQZ0_9ACTN|nr:hypothetical protein DDQ41_08425 [Streptomyces spongiicola]